MNANAFLAALTSVSLACSSGPSKGSTAEQESTGAATSRAAPSKLDPVDEGSAKDGMQVNLARFVDTTPLPAPPTVPFLCSPKSLSTRDTLDLAMHAPHGNYLTVTAPDGTAFFVIYPQLGDSSRKYSLIPSETFRHVSHLRLPADIQANPRVYGRPNLESLFTKPGKYVFLMGENLEGDFGEKVHRCTVQFSP